MARRGKYVAMGTVGKKAAGGGSPGRRGYYLPGGLSDVFPVLFLGVLWRGKHVEIGETGVKVAKGFRRYRVRWEEIVAVFTTMMPTGDDFHEVLAVEFLVGARGGILALDPAWGFDLSEAMAALREGLGGRWEELYLGHKHASEVRGLE